MLLHFTATLSYYQHFSVQAVDMGIFINAIHNCAFYGDMYTWTEGFIDHSAVHLQPIIYIFAVLLRMGCNVETLLFLQAFFAFLGVFYIYSLSVKITGNKLASFFIAASLVISPYFLRIIHLDFHPAAFYFPGAL